MTRTLPLLILFCPTTALALPQYAVLSARACDNCHVDPVGWQNPDVSERKCSLSCGSCHVNPTGGGARKISGRYFGQEILPMLGFRPSERVQSVAPPPRLGPPSVPSSRPAGPGPGSEDRFAGADPTPWFYYGGDFRVMYFFQQHGETGDDGRPKDQHVIFPMQTDLYLGGSPYNPDEYNAGRLTLMTNLSVLGSRGERFDGFFDRFFLKEYYALFHDLPYQLYAKLGQFMPAFGWRLDDHTAFIRQGQTFTNERQVTGVEVGLNPNYLFAHASFYVNGPLGQVPAGSGRGVGTGGGRNRYSVFDLDNGLGGALHVGYRDLLWQLAGSFMFEDREATRELWAGASWGLNLHDATHRWKGFNWAPIIYLGEIDYRSSLAKGEGRTIHGLAAFHEVDLVVIEGLFLQVRYDWQDPDLDLVDDHRHRYTAGVAFHPVNFVEIIAQARINVEAGEDRLDNQALLQLHLWY